MGCLPHLKVLHFHLTTGKMGRIAALLPKLLICRKACPTTAAIIDSQSVKMFNQPEERGFDAGMRTMGRKRHLLADTLGLTMGVTVSKIGMVLRLASVMVFPYTMEWWKPHIHTKNRMVVSIYKFGASIKNIVS